MKKKIKCCLLGITAIWAVTYFFDINFREIYSSLKTAFIDNIDAIFPGAKAVRSLGDRVLFTLTDARLQHHLQPVFRLLFQILVI